MASDVDVCNMALAHFGSEAVVTSINPPDGSVEAGHCKRFFALARQQALEMATFSWTKKRAQLAAVTNPSTVWKYAYALPSDCLLPRRVLLRPTLQSAVYWSGNSAVISDDQQIFSEQGSADFEIEDGVLLTNEAEAVLLYTRDVTDLTKASATFISGFSYMLASMIAGPLIKGDAGAKAAMDLREAARRVLTESAVHDANATSERSDHIPDHIRVR